MLQSIACTVVGYLNGVPGEVATFLIAMIPILEQRLAIPVGMLIYNMPAWKTYVITMAGNIGPVMVLLYFADAFNRFVHRYSHTFFGRYWFKKLKQAQDGFAKYEKYGLWGLTIFVVSPVPGSGIFTGAMIAFLMGVPFKHSWKYLVGAILGSGLITLLITMGADQVITLCR